jgi:predicted metal-dependent hydrolase
MQNKVFLLRDNKDLGYDIILSKRRSLQISVHPDKSVVVRAPKGSNIKRIQEWVQKRSLWIKKQIVRFEQYTPKFSERKYIDGESHLYLGRKYKLKISLSTRDRVLLKNGCLNIESIIQKPEHINYLLYEWYYQKADVLFEQIFTKCWEQFKKYNVSRPNLKIKKMKSRWGSFSLKGNLSLNLELIRAPKECIEYVLIHELCHLLYHNHGKGFYKLLIQTLPDWKTKKQKLYNILSLYR